LRLLLDTNIVVMLLEDGDRLSPAYRHVIEDAANELQTSVISFWEMAIKYRSGKLALAVSPDGFRDEIERWGIGILRLDSSHATADSDLPASLKDPFDRMFVAIAEIEQMKFLTTDAKLLEHPLAWRP
jgi:PIN domain nuclease of toxin-antitoxin system